MARVTGETLKRIIIDYLVNGYSNGLKQSSIERYLRDARNEPWFSRIKIPKREIVGVISDTHIPFEHPNYLKFCVDTFKRYGVTRVVHIGDLVDNHAISRHQSETSAMSAESEYAVALKRVGLWTKAFPKLTLCTGNHDLIPHTQAATLGMPEPFLKTLRELWMLPKGWNIVPEVIIDGVYYFHGIGSTGKTPAYNRMANNRMSTVQGHTHSRFGVAYHANPTNI